MTGPISTLRPRAAFEAGPRCRELVVDDGVEVHEEQDRDDGHDEEREENPQELEELAQHADSGRGARWGPGAGILAAGERGGKGERR
ncbi:MAG: hypothetical protein R3F60_30720 [bacterium]